MENKDESLEEDLVYFNLILQIRRSNGSVVQLTKVVDQFEDIPLLYIPQIDVSLHGKLMGMSHDRLIYRKFNVNLSPDDEANYTSIIEDFTHSNWVFSFDSDLDN